jgi:hypothetical protein
MKNKANYIILAVAAVIFLFMVFSFGIDKIAQNLLRIGWYFIPITGVWFFVYLCNAVAWRFIIDRPDIPFKQIFSVTISGYAINYITPLFHLGGEPYRVYALKDTLGLNRAVSVTISYVMLHFLSSFLIWIAGVVVALLFIPLPDVLFVILLISLFVFGFVVWLFIKGYKNGVTKSFASFFVKLPLLKKFSSKVGEKEAILREIDDNTKELYQNRKKDFIAANFFEVLSRVVATLEYFFIMKAIGLDPTLLEAFIINAGLGLIANMFFVVPFELGVKEGGLYTIMGFLKYTPSIGIFVGIVNRIRELFWIMIGLALIYYTGRKNDRKELKSILYDESNIV